MNEKETVMRKSRLLYCWVFIVLGLSLRAPASAQPVQTMVQVIVAPDHADWAYKLGEKAKFSIAVLRWGNPLRNVSVRYEVMPEKMEPVKTGTLELKESRAAVDGGTMKSPGFLQCWARVTVDGKEYSGFGTAAFEPDKIQPTTDMPKDFVEFWEKAKAETAGIPMDPRMSLLPERCTETIDVYHISFQHYREKSRIYGILCLPRKEGKYPALLRVPGAGVRGYAGDIQTAQKGIITLQIGVNGLPVTMDPGVYWDLYYGGLNEYWLHDLDNKDRYYYRRVYTACVRAVDFIFSLPKFDGSKIAVAGGSQGGALSIITAVLDPRIKWLACYYPALCDLTGYLHGRAGGWPHMFDKANAPFHAKKDKIETSKYYDVVNFARLLKIPGYYTWGFNDVTCPPTSIYAAYNVIRAPKKLLLAQDTGHWTYPEQAENVDGWLTNVLAGDGSREIR